MPEERLEFFNSEECESRGGRLSHTCPLNLVICVGLLVRLIAPGWNYRDLSLSLFPLFMWTVTSTELSAHGWDKGSSRTNCGDGTGGKHGGRSHLAELLSVLALLSTNLEPPVLSATLSSRSWIATELEDKLMCVCVCARSHFAVCIL